MYRTILVPVNETLESTVAAERARELASCFDAVVHLLHVVPPNRYRFDVGTVVEIDEARKRIEELATEVFADSSVDVHGTVRRGGRREETLEYLDEIDADLLVFGRKETEEMRDYLPWNELPRLVRESNVSVLLARSEPSSTEYR